MITKSFNFKAPSNIWSYTKEVFGEMGRAFNIFFKPLTIENSKIVQAPAGTGYVENITDTEVQLKIAFNAQVWDDLKDKGLLDKHIMTPVAYCQDGSLCACHIIAFTLESPPKLNTIALKHHLAKLIEIYPSHKKPEDVDHDTIKRLLHSMSQLNHITIACESEMSPELHDELTSACLQFFADRVEKTISPNAFEGDFGVTWLNNADLELTKLMEATKGDE